MYDRGSSNSPFSQANLRPLFTRTWPSSVNETSQRSRGRGAGPSKLIPDIVNPLPWHGHLNLRSFSIQFGVQPRCVHTALIAKILAPSFTTHTLRDALNDSSTVF